jgi:hypothetical protein
VHCRGSWTLTLNVVIEVEVEAVVDDEMRRSAEGGVVCCVLCVVSWLMTVISCGVEGVLSTVKGLAVSWTL